ncbi:VanZ like protein [Klugiella xanthotipulae]|uniref:VanZ like protein n=1 Tax=Klugiella xanthotipulae TaxID=244735 RepID=A0A543I430_9MICO|nr:VanZ like protein [Klugiella xanthotipulae]
MMFRQHPRLTVFTVVYLAIVAWMTLGPQPLDDHGDAFMRMVAWRISLWEPLNWFDFPHLEFISNILMFVPGGMFLILLLGRRYWWFAVQVCVLATVGIETVQMFLPQRVPDLRDVIANTIGGMIGVTVAMIVTYPAARVRKASVVSAPQTADTVVEPVRSTALRSE